LAGGLYPGSPDGRRAKELSFEVRLTYVILDGPERSIERVRWRIAKGGHSVPENKIIERYARSLERRFHHLRPRCIAANRRRHKEDCHRVSSTLRAVESRLFPVG
jgi:predicted ABC-type ATPase